MINISTNKQCKDQRDHCYGNKRKELFSPDFLPCRGSSEISHSSAADVLYPLAASEVGAELLLQSFGACGLPLFFIAVGEFRGISAVILRGGTVIIFVSVFSASSGHVPHRPFSAFRESSVPRGICTAYGIREYPADSCRIVDLAYPTGVRCAVRSSHTVVFKGHISDISLL